MRPSDLNETYLGIIKEENEQQPRYSLPDILDRLEADDVNEDDIVQLLNIAICDELLAEFNYKISYTISKTEGKADCDPEFKEHEKEESDHADKLINRLREMDKEVLMIPWSNYIMCNSNGPKWQQETSSNTFEILVKRYNEELDAIKFYDIILKYLYALKKKWNEFDSSTERLIKSIKADEEKHAKDLKDLLVENNIEI